MSQLTNLWNRIDDYKRAKINFQKNVNHDYTLNELLSSDIRTTVAVTAARSIIRRFMFNIGVRAEDIYTEGNKLVFELEPGGIPELLKEMLRKKEAGK